MSSYQVSINFKLFFYVEFYFIRRTLLFTNVLISFEHSLMSFQRIFTLFLLFLFTSAVLGNWEPIEDIRIENVNQIPGRTCQYSCAKKLTKGNMQKIAFTQLKGHARCVCHVKVAVNAKK